MTTLMDAYREMQDMAEKTIDSAGINTKDLFDDPTDEEKQKVINTYDDLADLAGLDGKECYEFVHRVLIENTAKLALTSLISRMEGGNMIADAYTQGMQTGLLVGAIYMRRQTTEMRKEVDGP